MRVRHESEGGSAVLASTVDRATGVLSRGRGLMFRRSIPDDYALVFEFDGVASRSLHMLFVPFPIDAIWIAGGEVTRVETLSAWTGLGKAKADLVIELPAGAAADVSVGDRVSVLE
ncbi:DUF192 domain-containing protein [Natranaeroarchaeum aerophilus]|uniref:DUF192 domain-containing protein n=1 Tax=Natranaeroarchaeum aerophilus TaxID=2917711 RepID=A0AAE3K5P4_9EURY|nr:DUF192 domain-containing protein [Natranaeroarchaeum aerophilus]